jgi:hypothetical protein
MDDVNPKSPQRRCFALDQILEHIYSLAEQP